VGPNRATSLGILVQNVTAANSPIEDANLADEVVNLTKFQVLNPSEPRGAWGRTRTLSPVAEPDLKGNRDAPSKNDLAQSFSRESARRSR